MSLFYLLILSFLFSLAFFTVFLLVFKRSEFFSRRREKKNQFENEDTSELKLKELEEERENLDKRLETLRESEEMLQSQKKEIELFETALEEQAKRIELRQSEIQQENIEVETRKRELAREREKVEILNKRNSEVMTNMSHELKTPLNSILTLTQVLLKNKTENLDEKQIKYLKTVYASGKTLSSLISDILDIAKIEAGRTDIFIEAIEVQTIKNEIFDTFYIQQEKGNIAFTINISENAPEVIYSDKKRLLQILRNIVSNAFKYTEKGFITVTIEKHNMNEQPLDSVMSIKDYIVFSVEDSGIGIEKDKQKLIFEEFVQADSSTTRSYSGTGLGLTISLRYAKLLGGDIQLESVPGRGSKFIIYLPYSKREVARKQKKKVEADDRKPESESKLAQYGKSFKNKKILVINPDMRYLFQITNLLEKHQAILLASDNLEDGIRKLQLYSDLSAIIVKDKIAEQDDYAFLREIASNRLSKHSKVLVISNDKEMEGYPAELGELERLDVQYDEEKIIKTLSDYLN